MLVAQVHQPLAPFRGQGMTGRVLVSGDDVEKFRVEFG